MSRNDSKTVSRTEGLSKSLHEKRRAFERQAIGLPGVSKLAESMMQPNMTLGAIIAVLFAIACTLIALWTRSEPLVSEGRVMNETRLIRVEQLTTTDETQTKLRKESARRSTPRVFVSNEVAMDGVVASIRELPATLDGVKSVDELDPKVQQAFGLTDATIGVVQDKAQEGTLREQWVEKTAELSKLLALRPLLDAQTYRRTLQENLSSTVKLVRSTVSEGSEQPSVTTTKIEVPRSDMVNIEEPDIFRRVMQSIARDAGFTQPMRDIVVTRLLNVGGPTYSFDQNATAIAQQDSEASVPPVITKIPRGEIIFRRGDVLSRGQREVLINEVAAYAKERSFLQTWLERASVATACGGIVLAMAGYSVLFAQRIRRRAARVLGLAMLLLSSLAVSCVGSVIAPNLWAPLTVLPPLLIAMLVCIGYDRRSALAFGLLHGFLTCLCLRENVAMMAIVTTGVACVASTLKEVRDRKSLVRTSLLTGLGVATAVIVFGLLSRPLEATFANTSLPNWLDESMPIVIAELLWDAILCFMGMLVVGGLTLFALPLIERAFNVITGMTLTDLRDPKRPLLRELQLRAPGTYTHSLNVASIAEQAAEAIGADSLLTYVGSLYHDVGKMNKPEYFVENQTPGLNRHDRLSPAMSLLIVVGHVKDGMELAKEFKLPVRLQHFIEAHHGTTLVEYFFHRAKKQALEAAARDGGDGEDEPVMPDEFEYRYPGPKPRTKEVAIIMIADASESACRAMGDPTPAKIDALVRSIANRRLQDGQFDDCEITLKEINAIVESVSRTLTSMYHGRIAYPGETERKTVDRAIERKFDSSASLGVNSPTQSGMMMPQTGMMNLPPQMTSTQMGTLPR